VRPLVFATRNPGKLRELRQLLTGIDVIDVDQAAARIGRAIPEPIEDAATFAGNAIKKALEVSRATGFPALADDSGLEVDALDGAPGVHSARYAGSHLDAQRGERSERERPERSEIDQANNVKLIAALAGIPAARRTARYRAVLALADVAGPLGDATLTADGTCEGSIIDTPRGSGGFGYDPYFLMADGIHTMAELPADAKNAVSHRGRAMRAIESQLRAYLAKL
jgi:XTP/dITP diphosphohydrolase